MPKKYVPTKLPSVHLCKDCQRQISRALKKQERCYICQDRHSRVRAEIKQLDAEYNKALRRHMRR